MQLCPNCGEENPVKFRLCGYCGAHLAPALPPQEVRKTVTIVFSDLKGSTNLGEALDSEALREVMGRYFDEMRAVLERHGGTIEKFIGDAVMAVFGLPKLHEDDAVRAVRAAAQMQRALPRLNDELERIWGVRLTNRTGVNTGEVVAGDPTTGQRLVTGDAVNVAARLEQAAPANEVLLGELTYRLVRDAVAVEEVEPLELKGKAERVPAYRLVSVAETGEGRPRRRDTPMVGREAELGLLERAFEEVLIEKRCKLVTVVGDAGVGKSRLNDELLQTMASRADVLRGRCLSYGEGITFWPLAEAVREAAGIREDDTTEVAQAKLEGLVGKDGEQVVERVASAIGLSVQQFSLDELFWGVRKLFEALARRWPLVVLFDDIHWAAPTFLDLIEHLVDSVQDAPVLLLCPARHELLEQRPAWAERDGAHRILLEPLTSADAAQIVANLLGEAGIAADAQRRIVAAAEGNPLFVEQLLSMLIDEGHLRFEAGRWAATSELLRLSVPPTIQALLASRLDRIDAEERAVVEPASVIGLVFEQDAVAELAPEPVRPQVPSHLSALTRKQFVRPDRSTDSDERFRFNHVLIREAAYNALLKRARASFHERFVAWADRVNLERGRGTEYEEILAYHLEQAHRYLRELGPLDDHGRELGVRAAERLASAGRRAFARGDAVAAANLLGRAASLLPEDDPMRLELLPDYGEALLQTDAYELAAGVLVDGIARADAAGLEAIGCKLVLVHLFVRLRLGDHDGWREDVERHTANALEVFHNRGDDAGKARAYRLLGWFHGMACRFGEAAAAGEQALAFARSAGDVRQAQRAANGYASAALLGSTPVSDAIARCEEMLQHVAGDRTSEGWLLTRLASLHAMQCSFEEARELYARGISLLTELGQHGEIAFQKVLAWKIEMLAGEPEQAERELREAYALLADSGDRYLLPSITGLLAQTLFELERFDEIPDLVTQTEELATDDDLDTQVLRRCIRAKLLAHEGRMDDAVDLVHEALEALEPTDAVLFKMGALLDLSRVLEGHDDEGRRAAIDRALDLAERKGDLATAHHARILLGGVQA